MQNGKPIILIEAKSATSDLNNEHASQLFRYFSVTDVRFGILTNGLQYRFHSDLEKSNHMDEKPFLIIDLFLTSTRALLAQLERSSRNLHLTSIVSCPAPTNSSTNEKSVSFSKASSTSLR